MPSKHGSQAALTTYLIKEKVKMFFDCSHYMWKISHRDFCQLEIIT